MIRLKTHSPLALALILAFAAETAFGLDAPAPAATADTYRARRTALLERLPEAQGYFNEGEVAPEVEHDIDFRQSSDFYFLTGVEESGAKLLVFREEGRPRHILFLRPHAPERVPWEGERLHAKAAAVASLGFDEVRNTTDIRASTRAFSLARGGDVHAALADMRLRKEACEVALLRRAIDITATALTEAMRAAEPGMAEYEIEAIIEYVFRRSGAARSGFPSIVGSGPNSCTLHYSRNGRVTEDGDLVVCDVGAEFGRYSADVTRTFPVSGRFSDEQRRVYEAVLRAQEAGLAAVKPGATVRKVHMAAYASLAEAGYAAYFTHGTSHWLGLDVHDVGDYDTPLEPGMVLTVEPGAYIAAKEIGVRIEDVALVTEDGYELLSAGVPRRVEEIEALMQEKGLGNEVPRPYPFRKKRQVRAF